MRVSNIQQKYSLLLNYQTFLQINLVVNVWDEIFHCKIEIDCLSIFFSMLESPK